MVKGVPIHRKETNLFDSLFIGSHKTRNEHLTTETPTSSSQPQQYDNRDFELMRLRILQEELEGRMRKYEKTIDFYQYSLILIIVLLMIKMIVDEVKK